MTTIMGVDLGEFKSLVRLRDPGPTAARFVTVTTDPAVLQALCGRGPAIVVFASGLGEVRFAERWAGATRSPRVGRRGGSRAARGGRHPSGIRRITRSS